MKLTSLIAGASILFISSSCADEVSESSNRSATGSEEPAVASGEVLAGEDAIGNETRSKNTRAENIEDLPGMPDMETVEENVRERRRAAAAAEASGIKSETIDIMSDEEFDELWDSLFGGGDMTWTEEDEKGLQKLIAEMDAEEEKAAVKEAAAIIKENQKPGVCFYTNRDFKGTEKCFTLPFKGDLDKKNKDTFSSVRFEYVSEDAPPAVRLFEKAGYEGAYIDIFDNIKDLSKYSFNNKAGSLNAGFIKPNDDVKICLFEKADFKGTKRCFGKGDREPRLSGLNDKVSSIKFEGQSIFNPLAIVLFEKNEYNGFFIPVFKNVANLNSRSFNDMLSSLKVTDAADMAALSPEVCLYEHEDFKGKVQCYKPGAEKKDLGNFAAKASSLKVKQQNYFNPVTYSLYAAKDFKDKEPFVSYYNLTDFKKDSGANDWVKSLKVKNSQ